jgi:hypothetical protein
MKTSGTGSSTTTTPSKPIKSFHLKNQETICYWIKQNLNYYCRKLDFIISFPKGQRSIQINNTQGQSQIIQKTLTWWTMLQLKNMEIYSLYRLKKKPLKKDTTNQTFYHSRYQSQRGSGKIHYNENYGKKADHSYPSFKNHTIHCSNKH